MNEATLRQLEYLVAVGEVGTIHGASELCNVSPVAVGHALTELDRIFGAPLTERKRARGARLTPEGAAVASEAREILRRVTQLPLIAQSASTNPRQILRIGVFAALSSTTVPGILRYFSQHHPHIELNFIEGDAAELAENLASAKVDALVAYRNQAQPGQQYFPIKIAKPCVLVDQKHRLAGLDSVSIEELKKETVVLLGLTPAQTAIRKLLEAHGLTHSIRWELRNIDTIRGIVGTGLAVAVLFSIGSTPHSSEGKKIVPIPLQGVELENAVAVFIPEQVKPVTVITSLIEGLRGVLTTSPNQHLTDPKENSWIHVRQ